MTPTEARSASIAWHRSQHDAVCDRIEPWEHGRLIRSSRFPTYWDYNLVYATGSLADMTAEDLVRVADAHHGDLAHRQLQLEDEAAGARLAPAFAALGWKVTPLVWMAHEGELPPVPDAVRLRAAPDDAARPLREQWYATEDFLRDPEVLRRFLDDERVVHDRLGGHVLLVDGDGPGGLAAYVRVRADGDTGEVAEAYAIPEVRGRGIGGTLVAAGARAIAAAGARHVLIVAEAEGRPRRLYERLGFKGVWTMHQLTRIPGTL